MNIILKVTDQIKEKAKEWSSFQGNKNSLKPEDPERLIIGNIAEMCFNYQYPNCERISDIDYEADFIYKFQRIDVKCVIGKYDPQPDFYAPISEIEKAKNADAYYFYYFNSFTNLFYDIGYISKKDYFANALKVTKGVTNEFKNTGTPRENGYRVHFRNFIKIP